MARLLTVSIDKVNPNPDNPRGEIDTTTDAFRAFVSTIEKRGFLQPLLVGPENADGEFTIVDGGRRYLGAVAAKVEEVPVMSLDAEGEELLLAAIANEQREALSPLAQAKQLKNLQEQLGLTQVQAAEAMGRSERWARERERILRMPEKTQAAYDEGVLPLESLATVEKIAKQAPLAAEGLAEAAAADDTVRAAMSGDRVPDALSTVIVDAAEKLNKDGSSKLGCFVSVGNSRRRERVTYEAVVAAGPPHDQLRAIKAAIKECGELQGKLRQRDRYAYVRLDPDAMWFEQADCQAAETFGCLLEIDGASYITDAAWLADRFLQHVQAVAKEITSKLETKKNDKKPKAEKGSPEAEKAAKEERRRVREAEEEARAAARANNLELGQRAQKELAAPKLSLEEAKLFALLAINAGEGIGAGFSYCYHDYQEEEKLKNGSLKVNYVTGSDAPRADLVQSILAAKKQEEALGLALRAMVLGHFADPSAAIPARSPGCWFPPGGGYGEADELSGVTDLIIAIAEKRNILPDAVRQEIEAEQQQKTEEGELELLKAVKASRARAGADHDSLLGNWRVTPGVIDAAVSRRHLKHHEKGDQTTYTLLGAGQKRLDKLKAAEKERQTA